MADNTTLNTGTGGDVIASDDIAGIKHQRVKIEYGVDGSATDVSDTNPLPVDDAGGSLTVDVGTALPAGDANIGNVDIVTVPAPLSTTGGGTEATALRVTIANDSTGVLSVDDNGGALTVDGTVAVTGVSTLAEQQTQTTALQKIDNLAHSGSDVALVEHVPISGQFDDVATSTVTENQIAPIRITSTRALHVAQQGTVTVSGTVTADLAAGTNNIGDVDVLTIAAGDNNIGNVDIVSLPASTNTLEVVGDVAHDVGVGGNPVLIAGSAQASDDTAPPNRVSAESDTTRLATDFDGAVFVHPHGPQQWSYHENSSSALTDTTVHAAPGAGLSLYVSTIVVSTGAATAMNVFLEEGASTVLGPYYLEAVAGRGFVIPFNPPKKITANTALTITTSAAIAHSIDITGTVGQG